MTFKRGNLGALKGYISDCGKHFIVRSVVRRTKWMVINTNGYQYIQRNGAKNVMRFDTLNQAEK